jgi:hypothetical protein
MRRLFAVGLTAATLLASCYGKPEVTLEYNIDDARLSAYGTEIFGRVQSFYGRYGISVRLSPTAMTLQQMLEQGQRRGIVRVATCDEETFARLAPKGAGWLDDWAFPERGVAMIKRYESEDTFARAQRRFYLDARGALAAHAVGHLLWLPHDGREGNIMEQSIDPDRIERCAGICSTLQPDQTAWIEDYLSSRALFPSAAQASAAQQRRKK